MADLLERTKTDRPCPACSRSRLLLSVAGNGCGKIPRPVRAQELDGFKPSSFTWARGRSSRGARTGIGLACSRRTVRQHAEQSGQPLVRSSRRLGENARAPLSFSRENASWRRFIVWGRAFRGSSAPRRLDWNDWPRSDFAFRIVSSFGNRVAGCRTRCRVDHGSAAAFEIRQRILGPSLECGFQPARARFRISSFRAQAWKREKWSRPCNTSAASDGGSYNQVAREPDFPPQG